LEIVVVLIIIRTRWSYLIVQCDVGWKYRFACEIYRTRVCKIFVALQFFLWNIY